MSMQTHHEPANKSFGGTHQRDQQGSRRQRDNEFMKYTQEQVLFSHQESLDKAMGDNHEATRPQKGQYFHSEGGKTHDSEIIVSRHNSQGASRKCWDHSSQVNQSCFDLVNLKSVRRDYEGPRLLKKKRRKKYSLPFGSSGIRSSFDAYEKMSEKAKENRLSPGPGQYCFAWDMGKNRITTHNREKNVGFGSGQDVKGRGSWHIVKTNQPAPGKYQPVISAFAKKSKQPLLSPSMFSPPECGPNRAQNKSPGPGSYDCEDSAFCKQSFARKEQRKRITEHQKEKFKNLKQRMNSPLKEVLPSLVDASMPHMHRSDAKVQKTEIKPTAKLLRTQMEEATAKLLPRSKQLQKQNNSTLSFFRLRNQCMPSNCFIEKNQFDSQKMGVAESEYIYLTSKPHTKIPKLSPQFLSQTNRILI